MPKMTKTQAFNRISEARTKLLNVYVSDFAHNLVSKADHKKLRDIGEQLSAMLDRMRK